MAADILIWPYELLQPAESRVAVKPFSRSGGPSLGGVQTATRTDLGWWTVDLVDIAIRFTEQRRTFDAISQDLGGRSGLAAVPAWSIDTAPYASGCYEDQSLLPHSDEASFSDGALYEQDAISVVTVGVTSIGATTIKIRVINGFPDMSGVRFSYNHALYQTGKVVEVEDDIWTVRIVPSIRATIPSGAELNFDRPTCLCNLVEDDGMSRSMNGVNNTNVTVSFVEATDYWYRLAKGLL